MLSYDYKYAPPPSDTGDKLGEQTPIPHTDYNFDEKDYRRELLDYPANFCMGFSFFFILSGADSYFYQRLSHLPPISVLAQQLLDHCGAFLVPSSEASS